MMTLLKITACLKGNTDSIQEKNGSKSIEVVKIGKKNKKEMMKPLRPCLVRSKLQSRLKRHILTKYKKYQIYFIDFASRRERLKP